MKDPPPRQLTVSFDFLVLTSDLSSLMAGFFFEIVTVSDGFVEQRRQLLCILGTDTFRQAVCAGVDAFTFGESDSARILIMHDLFETRPSEAFHCAVHQFAGHPATTHLVCHGGSSAGAGENIQHYVTRVGGDVDDPLKEALWFWGRESVLSRKKRLNFLLGVVCMSDFRE